MTDTKVEAQPASPHLARIVCWLGVAQIISWGSLYYSLTVLARPIRAELGFTDLTVFGAFTVGLLVSGVAAPAVGRLIDRIGGRSVMTLGSIVAAFGLLIVASSSGAVQFTFGWMLAGIAMTACLYDPAFATLHQIAPERYRRSVTGLTLFGGFASTVFWPLANALATRWGWRSTLVTFALLNLLLCVPIHRWVIPRRAPLQAEAVTTGHSNNPPVYLRDRRFWWLAASFAAATFVFGALSAFMMTALGSRGFSVAEAVWIAALIGPMQVLARVVEWMFGARVSAVGVGVMACALAPLSMALISTMSYSLVLGAIFAICYGASNGILTIARGTVPSELFGPQPQGALLGALSRPSFGAKAVAPALFAAGTTFGLTTHGGLLLLAGVSTTALACMLLAIRRRDADHRFGEPLVNG